MGYGEFFEISINSWTSHTISRELFVCVMQP